MPHHANRLTLGAADAHIRSTCAGGAEPGRRGVEAEWLTHPVGAPDQPVDFSALRAAADPDRPLANGGRITFEPGGQIEVSSAPFGTAVDAVRGASADVAELRRRVERADVELLGLGLDWQRDDRRVLDHGRYAAMEAFFDGGGPHGRRMMCRTASVQPNVPLGPDLPRRWRLVHLLAPVLAAAFANSPLCGTGLPSGWQSARLATWWAMDPTRTTAARHAAGDDPTSAWVDYVLDAHVMLVRRDDSYSAVEEKLRFRDWIRDGHHLGEPTVADLDYHLTTLFPPVRMRGWFEVRVVDALPEPWWPVPLLLLDAVLEDPAASAVATEACGPVEGQWVVAARGGLADPGMRDAAAAVFDAAVTAMAAAHAPHDLVDLVSAYADAYPRRGRCPADDRLDEWTAGGGRPDTPALARDAELSWT